MNLNFGDPLIDARTRAFDEYEGVNEKQVYQNYPFITLITHLILD